TADGDPIEIRAWILAWARRTVGACVGASLASEVDHRGGGAAEIAHALDDGCRLRRAVPDGRWQGRAGRWQRWLQGLHHDMRLPQPCLTYLEGDLSIDEVGRHLLLHDGAAHRRQPHQRDYHQQDQRSHQGHAALAGIRRWLTVLVACTGWAHHRRVSDGRRVRSDTDASSSWFRQRKRERESVTHLNSPDCVRWWRR